MKKGRSGLLLTALAQTEHVASVSNALLRHGSTFGVRHSSASRQVTLGLTVDTPWGEVRVKIGALNGEGSSPRLTRIRRCTGRRPCGETTCPHRACRGRSGLAEQSRTDS